jgi:hypothetical protein
MYQLLQPTLFKIGYCKDDLYLVLTLPAPTAALFDHAGSSLERRHLHFSSEVLSLSLRIYLFVIRLNRLCACRGLAFPPSSVSVLHLRAPVAGRRHTAVLLRAQSCCTYVRRRTSAALATTTTCRPPSTLRCARAKPAQAHASRSCVSVLKRVLPARSRRVTYHTLRQRQLYTLTTAFIHSFTYLRCYLRTPKKQFRSIRYCRKLRFTSPFTGARASSPIRSDLNYHLLFPGYDR